MTREEAIEVLENGGWWDLLIPITTIEGRIEEDKLHEALDLALTALRPVSRERVERVWYRRGWKYDNLRADGGIVYSATNTCMYCGSETPIGNFCYRCGIAQTDMAVDVVMERLEAITNATD